MLLEIKDISKHFGGLAALSDLSFQVEAGEILGLIGPNGAGKTTLFNVISGFFPPTYGKIFLQGEDITGLRPDGVAQKGLVRTFQSTYLFKQKTVLENLIIAHHLRVESGFLRLLLNSPRAKAAEGTARESSLEILRYMNLEDLKDELAKNLPHGHQRALGVAIALAARPRLLLLDEPSLGLAPLVVRKIFKILREINGRGTSILLVEQNARMALSVAVRGYVLEEGRIALSGSAQELMRDEKVRQAYLGEEVS